MAKVEKFRVCETFEKGEERELHTHVVPLLVHITHIASGLLEAQQEFPLKEETNQGVIGTPNCI